MQKGIWFDNSYECYMAMIDSNHFCTYYYSNDQPSKAVLLIVRLGKTTFDSITVLLLDSRASIITKLSFRIKRQKVIVVFRSNDNLRPSGSNNKSVGKRED